MTIPISATEANRHSRVLGVAAYRPRRLVDNAEIAANTGLDEDWIVRRSGIRTRRYAEADESLPVMATSAAAKALAAAGIESAKVDCVIAASITHLVQTPALAVDVAYRLGATSAAAFDVSAACAGFCHALALAADLVRTGQAETVVVIGAERMSDILDHRDPETAFLFADGAGAAVVGPSSEPAIGPVLWRADGSRMTALGMSAHWTRDLIDDPTRWPVITMAGWKVFRWTTTHLVPTVHAILERSGVTIDQIDAFVPHQANILITDYLVDALQLAPHTTVARDIVDSGNTSAASIPLALDQLVSSGAVGTGDLALLLGFGAGLVMAGQVIRLP